MVFTNLFFFHSLLFLSFLIPLGLLHLVCDGFFFFSRNMYLFKRFIPSKTHQSCTNDNVTDEDLGGIKITGFGFSVAAAFSCCITEIVSCQAG